MVWMSRHLDTTRSMVFFEPPAFLPASGQRVRDFSTEEDVDWLTLELALLGVQVLDGLGR